MQSTVNAAPLYSLVVSQAIRRLLLGPRARLGGLRGFSLACAVSMYVMPANAELPQVCVTCANGTVTSFVSSGAATATTSGNNLTVNQTSANAVLNWQSFNISSGSSVTFRQPGTDSVALNRIYQNSASQILGNLTANGKVYLLNQNGFVFGSSAVVNVGGLLATSLDFSPDALDADGNTNLLNAGLKGSAAFQLYTSGASGDITVLNGADIKTADGGQVLMFAPNIFNRGSISTPGGQAVLAAGTSVYLMQSKDDNLRGILVEVDTAGMDNVGTVENGVADNAGVTDTAALVGQIVAERGNVTLAGLAVNQLGRVSATTTVSENGSIRLQARSGGGFASSGELANTVLKASNGGKLTLGEHSVTEVQLADSTETAVDDTEQLKSHIDLLGRDIEVLDQAQVIAHGGQIVADARANPGDGLQEISGAVHDGSRIYIADGAVLDVSGANIQKTMESNVIAAELRADELADSPQQRDGALYGKTVYVDVRKGTSVADVSGQVAAIKRDVAERNLTGGTIELKSQGDVITAQGSTLDISGGSITYDDGYIKTTQLLGADGKLYDIGVATADRTYTGISRLQTITVTNARWGVTKSYSSIAGQGTFEKGYVEGKDAGTVSVLTPQAVLDGDIKATTQVGRYQRNLSKELAEGQVYRTYDQLPLGGTLSLGREASTSNSFDRVTGNIEIGGGQVLSSLQNFNPREDALPEEMTATRLRSGLFGNNAIRRVRAYSNDSITMAADVSLDLGGQGALVANAQQVNIAGQIHAASGNIDISAGIAQSGVVNANNSLTLASTAQLDVAGLWINDSTLLNATNTQPAALLTTGGKVTLTSTGGDLTLSKGSVIDVSGGAWASSSGKVTAGKAGSVGLSASSNLVETAGQSSVLTMDGQLQAFGLSNGGSLSISAPEICVSADGQCGSVADSTLMLTPETLTGSGFANVSLKSNERGLLVESGTTLKLQQQNRILNQNALRQRTGTSMSALTTTGVLADDQRQAMNLTLTTAAAGIFDGTSYLNYSNSNYDAAPTLTIESGARIEADPTAKVTLESNTSLLMNGAITAQGGAVSLRLNNSLGINESLDAQGIWLGTDSVIDVSGVVKSTPNDRGLRQGTVLDGGSVSIEAQRGAVVTQAGSLLDVSGTSTTLDIARTNGAGTAPTLIASDGGSISIVAADAVVLAGSMDAHAGSGSATAAGGKLSVALDANQRGAGVVLMPVETLQVVVSQQNTSSNIAAGTALPEEYLHQARVSADDVTTAGFSSVTLTANTSQRINDVVGTQTAEGSIAFQGDVNLTVGRELVLDAARITGTGNVSIAAPAVQLGHTDKAFQQVAALEGASAGQFTVAGSFIEVTGDSTIDGFAQVNLHSDGDLRLRGIQKSGDTAIKGSLTTAGDLLVKADQVYATTLSQFGVTAGDAQTGTLRIESTGGERDTVLSAASHLTLNAHTIEQAGVLRAPFGTIELNATNLTLEEGSLTSTSAEGAVIPFGSTEAGEDWIYQIDGQKLVIGDTAATPSQNVQLNGVSVDVKQGATIDLSGGGDLLASEFVSGTGGTVDVLASTERYAIVPAYKLTYAAYDTQESKDSTLAIGQTVHIGAGVDGLAEGDYVLLPARYALLDGAYVVEAISGYTDMSSGTSFRLNDGSTIVSGYLKTANTTYADARASGFKVTPAATLAKQAQYDTTLGSELVSNQNSISGGALRAPQDAGVLSISAVSQLNIDGQLRAAAASNGRGAAVDISADNLLVSDNAVASNGEVVVSASDLTKLGAESLLLGGTRSSSADGTALNVTATQVTVAGDADLTAPEIIVAARDTVRVQAGAGMEAKGSLPVTDHYVVEGDSAVLRLAAGEQAAITRNNESAATGTLILEQGAQLTATGGALTMDASREAQSAATLNLQGGSLGLGASSVTLASDGVTAAGLVLDAAAISNLQLRELSLNSRSTIDLYGNIALDVQQLSLDAAGLRGQANSTGTSITASERVLITNRDDRTATDAATSAGDLQINAKEVAFGAGTQRITGYDSVAVFASGQVRGEQTGGLDVAGDLTVRTPLVLAETAASTTLSASRSLLVTTPAGVNADATRHDQLGGSIILKGGEVSVATRVEAAAGSIQITATQGDVDIDSGAIVDVSGRERDYDGTVKAATAGTIALVSTQGNVSAAAGSVMDLSATAAGKAGHLSIKAVQGSASLNGTLYASAASSIDSGHVAIDAGDLGDVSALNTALNAAGFEAERTLRQRGAGNIELNSTDTLTAHEVSLTADQGSVLIDGVIDAQGADGGTVVLSARDDVTVNGSILAQASDADGAGGKLELRNDTGRVAINSAAQINLTAGADNTRDGGELNLRVTRDQAALLADTDVSNDGVVLAGSFSGVKQTSLEAYQRYTDAALGLSDGVLTTADTNTSSTMFTEASTFVSSTGDAIIAALKGRTGGDFRLLAGVEVQSAGDLSVGQSGGNQIWDLSTWRFSTGGVSDIVGTLTLRAAGNLTINGSLNDGFSATGLAQGTNNSAAFKLTNTKDTWSYRLVSGADNQSADVLAVNSSGEGDFTIAEGEVPSNDTSAGKYRVVRTGNGSIEVATGGDFVLGNQASTLYTAGVASTDSKDVTLSAFGTGSNARDYPVDGGDITTHAQGDILGAQTTQLVNDWLWRANGDGSGGGSAAGWTVNFARFMQNVGALAGGEVNITAGGDITNFSASVASIGQQVGGKLAAESKVNVLGGGDLTVQAVGNIAGGSYYVGKGQGELDAGGSITSATYESSSGTVYELNPILAAGDGEWTVTAIGDATIEALVNPTLLAKGKSQTSNDATAIFSTYGDSSGLSITSVSGDVGLSNSRQGIVDVITTMQFGDTAKMLEVYAPSLSLTSLSGDVRLTGDVTLWPAKDSTVTVLAEDSIVRGSLGATTLTQSDADQRQLPTLTNPSTSSITTLLENLKGTTLAGHAATPVHSGDSSITQLVARTGDINFKQNSDENQADESLLKFSTPVRMYAGGEVIDLPLEVQHDDAGDVSTITAGGDISYGRVRRANGNIDSRESRQIVIDGPGTLLLTAGGDVNLQTSGGITSRGNTVNTHLSDTGASINVLAGLNGKRVDYSSFEQTYIASSMTYSSEVIAYVESITGIKPQSDAEAVAAFANLSESQKQPFLQKVLLAELSASAKEAASTAKSGDYSRGFKAMNTLFPDEGSYDGDIALYFSRIYTLDGGDITLLTPGGGVNAGLASPPSSFGISKGADRLGLVTRSTGNIGIAMDKDLQVNESRVFAVNNSDIVVWSSNGDIDAGRGAKTAISAPATIVNYDRDGKAVAIYSASLDGSGIQTRATTTEFTAGDVVLAAPRGVVNAGDAGIVAGNLTIAATAVLGADNIKVSGVSVGVPVNAGGLGASLAGVSAAASGASSSSVAAVSNTEDNKPQDAPLTQAALSWLDVFVVGLGEENCRQDDLECLKRQP